MNQMKQRQLKLLGVLEQHKLTVELDGSFWWKVLRQQNEQVNVLEAEYSGQVIYRRSNVPDILHESTYHGCVDAELTVVGGKMRIRVVMYEGDSMYGHRLEKRCHWVFEVKTVDELIVFMSETCRAVEQRVKEYATDLVIQEEIMQKKQRVLNKFNELLV